MRVGGSGISVQQHRARCWAALPSRMHSFRLHLVAVWLAASLGGPALASDWLDCATVTDNAERLACFDQKALQFANPLALQSPPPVLYGSDVAGAAPAPAPASSTSAAQRISAQPSEITRFWDLEHAIARNNFELRAYRPVSLSLSGGSAVNRNPSPSAAGNVPTAEVNYQPGELKINLSVRTKIVSGILRGGSDPLRDSLWFGYTQQSYWQLFNKDISRPFRNTDHEPELVYVFPHFMALPGGWTYRLSAAGLVHQSNGQSLPLSRSWNRTYVMGAADKIADNGDRFTLQARVWRRMSEKAGKDDNPDISDFVGRGELVGRWSFDAGLGTDRTLHTLGFALRHSLRSSGKGSVRLEYLRSIGRADGGLRFHAQLFSGYGENLLDYNRNRTVASLGLSLVDW
jgi:phospholipase A1